MATADIASATRPTREELVERATAMIPTLRERADRCEELRQIPPETVEDFIAAGFHKITQPVRYGGYGHDLNTSVEVGMEIARACGSSGWMASFWSGHSFEVGWFSEEAQGEYWSSAADPLSSTASALVAFEREELKDGLRVSGRFKFSSGVDYACWVLLQTAHELFLLPRSDFTIDDDWFVSGLKGTGSKTIVFENAFVPEHRIVSNENLAKGTTYGAHHYESPYYRLHRILSQPTGILAPIVGMAQGVVDVFDERVRSRRDPLAQLPAFERPGNQLRFAESAAEVDTARLLLRHILAETAEWGRTGCEPSLEERAKKRREFTFATKLCTRAVDRLAESGDASALYDVNALHRLARDTRAGALQFVMTWDEMAIQYSRVRWGLEPQTLVI